MKTFAAREREVLFKQRDKAIEQREEALSLVEQLRAQRQTRVLTCVYCGHEYPQDTPAHGHEILTAHIAVCEKHPVRGFIELLAEATQRLEEAQLIGQMSHRFQAWVHGGQPPISDALQTVHAIIDQRNAATLRADTLQALIDTPGTEDFLRAVQIEAAHQEMRFGTVDDAGKKPSDWFWLLGFLGGKALHAAAAGDTEKALHHTISSGAACLNWHRHLSGKTDGLRPGIEPPRDNTTGST